MKSCASFLFLSVFLSPALADVSGIVTDNTGKPAVGAFVRYVDASDSSLEADTYTNASGKYVLKLPAKGSSSLRSRQGAPQPGEEPSTPGPQDGRFFYNLQGRVVAKSDSRLILFTENGGAKEYAGMEKPLMKSAAAGSYHITVYGKGIYPMKARNIAVTDGDVKDFTLKGIPLWDSTRAVLRDDLRNSRYQFMQNKTGRVAFFGGSITFNPGWRDSISNYLKKKYPQTTFDFINAGIPSVGINMHAFRAQANVFFKGKVDLLFLESAVNDTTNGVPSIERTRAYEGIVRQALKHNPNIDIVYMYFADDVFYPNVAAGKPIPQVADYEKSAWQYGISSLNLAQYVAEHYTWTEFGGNVHPGPFGQGIYTQSIQKLLNAAWNDSISALTYESHFFPVPMMDSLCYYQGHLDTISKAVIVNGWKRVASWTPTQGGTRDGFFNIPVLEATTPGDTVKFAFTGTAVGIVIPAGPDVGQLDFMIDGKFIGTQDQFTAWSSTLNIPWTILFSGNLTPAPHEIKIITGKQKNTASQGYACRIIRFIVNGP